MQNYCYNQVKSACALDLFLFYNYSKFSANEPTDSIFTQDFANPPTINLQSLTGFTLNSLSLSIRASANIVISRSFFFNFVFEYGSGFGRSKLFYNSSDPVLGTSVPFIYNLTLGAGLALKRIMIKAYMSLGGRDYEVYSFRTVESRTKAMIAISYRLKEPKKLKDLRERTISKGKQRVNDIISP